MVFVVKQSDGLGYGVYLDHTHAVAAAQSVDGTIHGPFDEIDDGEHFAYATHNLYKTQFWGYNGLYNRNLRAVVYADGCCLNNHSTDAVRLAGYGVYWGHNNAMTASNESWTLFGSQSNNRAAIWAMIRAVEGATQQGFRSLVIRTDSKYAINCASAWMDKWIENGWKTIKGNPVTNQDDLMELYRVIQNFGRANIVYEHVSAGCGDYGWEQATRLAREGAVTGPRHAGGYGDATRY